MLGICFPSNTAVIISLHILLEPCFTVGPAQLMTWLSKTLTSVRLFLLFIVLILEGRWAQRLRDML